MPTLDHFESVCSRVTGYMTQRHAWAVYGLVRCLRPVHCVEVGTYRGYVGMHIAKALDDNGSGHLTVIDDFSLDAGPAHVHNNFQEAGLAHRLTILDGRSQDVPWPRFVDFAFIDGDHDLESVVHDCNTAIERGAKCLVLHDTAELPGPREYVECMREKGPQFWDVVEWGFDMGCSVLVRREEKPPMYSARPKTKLEIERGSE